MLHHRRDSALGRTVRSKGWRALSLFRLRCLAFPQVAQSEQRLPELSGHYPVIHDPGPGSPLRFLQYIQKHIQALSYDVHLSAAVALDLMQAGLRPLPP